MQGNESSVKEDTKSKTKKSKEKEPEKDKGKKDKKKDTKSDDKKPSDIAPGSAGKGTSLSNPRDAEQSLEVGQESGGEGGSKDDDRTVPRDWPLNIAVNPPLKPSLLSESKISAFSRKVQGLLSANGAMRATEMAKALPKHQRPYPSLQDSLRSLPFVTLYNEKGEAWVRSSQPDIPLAPPPGFAALPSGSSASEAGLPIVKPVQSSESQTFGNKASYSSTVSGSSSSNIIVMIDNLSKGKEGGSSQSGRNKTDRQVVSMTNKPSTTDSKMINFQNKLKNLLAGGPIRMAAIGHTICRAERPLPSLQDSLKAVDFVQMFKGFKDAWWVRDVTVANMGTSMTGDDGSEDSNYLESVSGDAPTTTSPSRVPIIEETKAIGKTKTDISQVPNPSSVAPVILDAKAAAFHFKLRGKLAQGAVKLSDLESYLPVSERPFPSMLQSVKSVPFVHLYRGGIDDANDWWAVDVEKSTHQLPPAVAMRRPTKPTATSAPAANIIRAIRATAANATVGKPLTRIVPGNSQSRLNSQSSTISGPPAVPAVQPVSVVAPSVTTGKERDDAPSRFEFKVRNVLANGPLRLADLDNNFYADECPFPSLLKSIKSVPLVQLYQSGFEGDEWWV